MEIPLTDDIFPLRKSFESSRDSELEYQATLTSSGTGVCDCQGFRYRRNCRHLKALREEAKELRATLEG